MTSPSTLTIDRDFAALAARLPDFLIAGMPKCGTTALYAGVKRTKDGLQMLMHDKRAFMDLLMRHAGMLNDSLKLKGDAENPLFTLLKEVQGTQLRPAGPEPEDE